MTTILIIAPAVRPVIAADEILLPTFANFSTFPTGLELRVDGEIELPTVVNLSTFPAGLRLTTGDEFDITLPLVVNHPLRILESGATRITEEGAPRTLDGYEHGVFGAIEIAESPPDGSLTLTTAVNVSTFPAGLELVESPPDGRIELPSVVNVSTFPAGLEVVNVGAVVAAAGAAAGTSTTAATGGSLAAADGAAAGVGTAAAVGASTAAASAASAGTSTAAAVSPTIIGLGLGIQNIRPKRTGLYKRPGTYSPMTRPRGAIACFIMDGSNTFETRELYSGRRSTFAGSGADLQLSSTPFGKGHGPSGSYFSLPSQQPLVCSVEAVVTAAVGAGSICGLNEGTTLSATYDRWLYINTSGQPVFYTFDTVIKKAVGAALTAGSVYHLCGTSDGSNIRLYVNGQLVATTATTNGGYVAYTNPCFMVAHNHVTPDTSTTYGGNILFTQFANVAWSAAEVRERAANPYAHAYTGEDWLRAFSSQGS